MPDPTLLALWNAHCVRTPQAAALLWDGQAVSYHDLNARANQLARHLRTLGVGPDVRVGLCVERGPQMCAAVLGILKAGGAYVPLDPAYPAERLQLMLSGADAPVLLTQSRLLPTLPAHPHALCLDTHWPDDERTDNPNTLPAASDLCYVLYTSGSTGVPKGVAMEHGALHNLIHWQAQNSQMGANDRTLQFASPSFDVSFQEMWATWATGGTLVLVPDTLRRDPRGLLRLIEREQVNRLFLPFVALHLLASAVKDNDPVPDSLREIMTAGEQLQITPPVAAFFRKAPQCRLFNQYGPSETHVVTQFALRGTPDTWPALPPIGTPIGGTEALVLNENMQPAPEGELYLGGACLARGYLGQPALTAERFLPHPFHPSARLYKTGDRCRLLPSGDIDFLGRADGQVKVRGFRVEVGEVEHALAQHPHVKQCAVTADADTLAAYVVTDTDLDPAQLRSFVSQSLPPYMVPSRFVRLDSLPLTPSGKVDRRGLAPPVPNNGGARQVFTLPNLGGGGPLSPRSGNTMQRDVALQEKLAALWQSVLSVPAAGPHDNFFDLGGHSLLAVRLLVQVEREWGVRLALPALLAAPTVAQMAALLADKMPAVAPSVPVSDILVPMQTAGTETPLVCVHHIDGNVICYREMAQALAPHQPVYGLQAPALTRPVTPPARVEEMAAEFVAELVRALPDGPYRLCGYSFGGVVALEMAQQLRAQGREVSLLALLDTYAPVAFRDNLIEKPALRRLPVHLHRMGKGGARGFFSYAAQKAREARTDTGSHFPPEPGEAGFLPAAMAAIKTASEAALRAYVPQPYAGRTMLLRATDLDPFENYDPRLWWGETFTGGLEIVDVPGPHLQMLRAPFVSTLAGRLAALLSEGR